MDFPTLVLLGIVGLLSPLIVLIMLRTVFKLKSYRFKMIFMNPGINKHFTVFGESLDFEHTVGEKEYEIKAERLYRFKPKLLRKTWLKLRGVKETFVVVYQHNKTDPVAPVTVSVSARILKEVSESRALDKALRSEFKVPWDLKKILMVIGFLVIAVVVWAVISGEISI